MGPSLSGMMRVFIFLASKNCLILLFLVTPIMGDDYGKLDFSMMSKSSIR